MAAAFRSPPPGPSGLPGAAEGAGGGAGQWVAGLVVTDRARIEVALEARSRYKYVSPQVLREGLGWKIVSPNCSRNVEPAGGEIDIAWLVPEATSGAAEAPAGWLLHARDHAQGCWRLKLQAATLDDALERLVTDEHREFWV